MNHLPDHDLDLTGWLCAHLPRWTADADRDRWLHKLNAALDAIRTGTPVAQAMAEQHLPIDLDAADAKSSCDRGGPGSLDGMNIDLVAVTGAYGCPGRPGCSRRAQPDADGHEPRCSVHDLTMILRSR